MECPICIDLARAFDAALSEYIEALSSACYQVSKRFAAKKKVDMERAKYAMEEHQCVCVLLREGACTSVTRRRVNEFDSTGGIGFARSLFYHQCRSGRRNK